MRQLLQWKHAKRSMSTWRGNVQKSVSVQPAEDGFLSAFDTGAQGVQDERTLKTDRQCEAFVCECRIYGKISGYYAGSGQHYGTDE